MINVYGFFFEVVFSHWLVQINGPKHSTYVLTHTLQKTNKFVTRDVILVVVIQQAKMSHCENFLYFWTGLKLFCFACTKNTFSLSVNRIWLKCAFNDVGQGTF